MTHTNEITESIKRQQDIDQQKIDFLNLVFGTDNKNNVKAEILKNK